jgi:hypothetical protein
MRERRAVSGLSRATENGARVAAAWAVAVVAASCGGTPLAPASQAEPADPAVALALALPHGDRCVVARPSRVADRRRSLIVPLVEDHAHVWARSPRIVAYASSSSETDQGSIAGVTMLRLAEPVGPRADDLRSVLPWTRVRVDGEPCRADDCALPVARRIDEHTIRIERGAVRSMSDRESPCVALALDHPSAIDLAAQVLPCPSGELACARRRVLELAGDGLVLRDDMLYEDARQAAALASAFRDHGDVDGVDAEIEVRGATVTMLHRMVWDDLELAAEDRRIERDALTRRDAWRALVPVDEIDVSRLRYVVQQARLRDDQIARFHGDRRLEVARELDALLSRARDAHPDEPDLGARLTRLRLDVLGDPRGAISVIDEVIARSGRSDDRLRLRREAYVAASARASSDHDALERATDVLLDGGIAPDRDAARAAARDFARLLLGGVAYEVAESAWMEARATLGRAIPLATCAAGSGAPTGSLPATLATLAELGGDRGPFSVFVVARRARDDAPPAAHAPSSAAPVLLRFDHAGDAPLLAGSAASVDALLQLGAQLEAELARGPYTIDVVLVSLSSPDVRRHARLVGEAGLARLRIDRADAWSARQDWPRVERYLAEPLRTLGARVFPPAELVVIAESEEEAARLAQVGADPPDTRCVARGVEIRCAPRPDADARGSLRRIAHAALSQAPRPSAR